MVKGQANASLLDTYEAERRPVALELSKRIVERQAKRFGTGPEQDRTDDQNWTLGQRYRSSAMVGADHEAVFGDRLDTRAAVGTRAPHLWLDRDGQRISTHDLFQDAFVLLTGSAGTPWQAAADAVGDRRCMPLRPWRVGSESDQVDLVDVENRWLSRYGVGVDGAVLVRPDGYVAWRSATAVDNPRSRLANAMHQILGAPTG